METECNYELHDQCYLCVEQEFIYNDIYATLAKPIRPMGATDLDHLSRQEYFADAFNLMTIQSLLKIVFLVTPHFCHLRLIFVTENHLMTKNHRR